MSKRIGCFLIGIVLLSLAVGAFTRIQEPHTRYNPYLEACVYFFLDGQCYVDPDYCSMVYGKNEFITLDKEEECIFSLVEYYTFLEEEKGLEINEGLKEQAEKEENVEVEEEVEEVIISGKDDGYTFTAMETELVIIEPIAEDPDGDVLEYTFSEPLNGEGEWQTNYGDSGEYESSIKVSDGRLSVQQDIIIIIERKEELPTINDFGPVEKEMTVYENSIVEFNIDAYDKNGDDLSYSWTFDGEEVGTDSDYLYDIGYDQEGTHNIVATVSDGNGDVVEEWTVTVINVNRIPELDYISDIIVDETDTVVIEPNAVDPDGQEMIYTISSPVGDDGVWDTTYDDAGEYDIVVTASDGEDEVSQTITITVENVNRAPVINDIIQK